VAAARTVLAVLCGQRRPPDMQRIETLAEVRYTDATGLSDALRGADALFVWDFLSNAVSGPGRTRTGCVGYTSPAQAWIGCFFPSLPTARLW
jgi:hypothetical protein